MAKSAPMNTPPQAAAVVGAGPILAAVARRIGRVATIDQLLTWDATRCRLSPGERILALILNWLTEREPLYQVDDAFRLTDPALLLGAGITGDDLGDDALGRARDKFAQAGPAAVFSAVAARAYAVEALDRGGMHGDSTSRSLYGRYPTADGAHGVTPRHGHSQDHRPDLKQILFTCCVNRDGVPLMGRVEDGNRSDKRLNGEQIARVVAAFRPEALQDLIYIADAALVTGPHREALHAAGIAWLSRLPDTFGAAATAKAAAWAADTWTALGRVAARPQAAEYGAAEHTATIRDRTYRLVVYRSSSLDQRKAKAFDRERARIRTAADRAAATLADQPFQCAADAEAAATAFRATAPRGWPCTPTVGAVTRPAPRARRGRPRADTPPAGVPTSHVAVAWGPRDEIAVRAELQRRSCFVLITTLPANRSDAAALLREDQGPNQRGATLSLPEGPHVRRRALSEEARTYPGVGACHVARAVAVQRGRAAGAGASRAAPHVQAGEPGAPHRLRDPQALSGDPGLLARPRPSRRGLPQPLPAGPARHPGGTGPPRDHFYGRAGPRRAPMKFTRRAPWSCGRRVGIPAVAPVRGRLGPA